MRIHVRQPVACRLEFFAPEVLLAEEDLSLEVGDLDRVRIHQAESADPCRRQIQGDRRAQASGPDAEHARRLQLALALDPEFGDRQVPRVAGKFVGGEVGHEPPTMACRNASATIQRLRWGTS